MNFFTHIFEGFQQDFKLLFTVIFLGIISWKGASRFNGAGYGAVFQMGGFNFKWGWGECPMRGFGWYSGWGLK